MTEYVLADDDVLADSDDVLADGTLLAASEGGGGGGGGTTVRYFFAPPLVDEMPRTTVEMSRVDARFWNHFRRNPVGRNIYKTTSGDYTTVQPERGLVAHIYFGGHIEEVDATEAALITAAGYTIQVTGTASPGDEIDEISDLAGLTIGSLAGMTVGDL